MAALAEIALTIFNAIFADQTTVELEGETYHIHKTRTGLRNLTHEGIWYIEQNPQKSSRYAKMAQEGHQILWGLKGRTYILRVLDGKYTLLKKT
ncbi:MAG: hypothetical protein ACFFDT_05985 [Candidatus Hodarchaeota archaeon]